MLLKWYLTLLILSKYVIALLYWRTRFTVPVIYINTVDNSDTTEFSKKYLSSYRSIHIELCHPASPLRFENISN